MAERDQLMAALASLIGDLSPTEDTHVEELHNAAKASLAAIHTGQDVGSHSRSSGSLERLSQDPLMKRLLDQPLTPKLPTKRVLRRSLTPSLAIDPSSMVQSGQKVTSSFGPFLDGAGRPVGVEILTPIQLVSFQRTGAATPFLYLGIPTPTGTSSSIQFGSCSVWIPAGQLVASQPATSFVGLSVQSGNLTLPSAVNLASNPITIPAAGAVELALLLPQPPTSPTTPPFHGNPSFSVPPSATFAFNPTGSPSATLIEAGTASISAWGSSVSLSGPTGGSAVISTLPPLVEFPFHFNQGVFSISQPDSSLVALLGSAPILGAAWALPITTAATSTSLAAAADAGGISLSLGPGVLATLTSTNVAVECGPCSLLVNAGLLALIGVSGTSPNIPQSISLGKNSSVTTQTPTPFTWEYVSESNGTEAWALQPAMTITLDQPRTINNDRVRLSGSGILAYILDKQGTERLLVSGVSATNVDLGDTQSYALKNLLIGGTTPASVVGTLALTNGVIASGSLAASFSLRFAVPFLPDPYTVNFVSVPGRSRGQEIGTFQTISKFQGDQLPSIDVNLSLASSAQAEALSITSDLMPLESAATGTTAPVLLDLSTNVSQFGVAFSLSSRNRDAATTATTIEIANLMFQAPGFAVDVLTLPAVQWEPVVSSAPTVLSDGQTPFPSPLSFPNSGQPTVLGTESVTLVPIAPRQAIDNVISSYNANPSSNVTASFTLPFGMTASATLAKTRLISVSPPGLDQVQPTFSSSNLIGGDQISLTGQSNRFVVIGGQAPSPHFPGTAVQTAQTTPSVSGTGTLSYSVLTTPGGDFTSGFNTQFENTVPLTRIDISGFGESVFSDWRDVQDTGTHASKVQLEVMVGRTAREVVQIVSTLYPFAVRVVRTITIERNNAGVVVRHDGGWQASSNGLYLFPSSTSITTHPGVVSGVTNVINIRDLGQPVSVASNTISLSAVAFDCNVGMENVVLGNSSSGVPAKSLTGYVQTTFGNELNAAQYAELLTKTGSLGGPIDCSINIGGSGQQMRVSQIGVGASQGSTGFEFVMTAWGSAVFPTGEWSFIMQQAGQKAPSAIAPGVGVPLIRAGPAPQPAPASNPYRFADPADLLSATTSTNYALCFSMATARIAFFLPKIEDRSPWAFTGTITPLLADPYALGTSQSNAPFPSVTMCIPFNDDLYQILISPKGDLQLQLSSTSNTTSFTTQAARRILLQSETATTVAQTGDENTPPNPSVVTLSINSAAKPTWSLLITNLSFICEVPSMASDPSDPSTGEVTRTVGDMSSAQGTKTVYQTPRLVFGTVMKPLKDAISFFEQFGFMPAPQVSMTNAWQVDEKVTIKLADFLKAIPVAGAFIAKFLDDLDFNFLAHGDGSLAYVEIEMELTIKIPLVGVFSLIFLLRFKYHVGTDGKSYLLTAGAGVGGEIGFGPQVNGEPMFKAKASIVATILGLLADHSWGVGAGVIIKASVNLVIIEVEVEFEARFMYLQTSCGSPQGVTKWGLTQIEIAIDIHIFIVLDISFHDSMEWKTNFNNGPCPMDVAGLTQNIGTPS